MLYHLLGRELLQTLVRKTLAQKWNVGIITDCPVNFHLFLTGSLFLTWWGNGMMCHLLLMKKLQILTLIFMNRNLSKFANSIQVLVDDVSELYEYCRFLAKHFSIWHVFLLAGWGERRLSLVLSMSFIGCIFAEFCNSRYLKTEEFFCSFQGTFGCWPWKGQTICGVWLPFSFLAFLFKLYWNTT